MLRTLCFSAILLVLVSFGFRQFSGKNGGHGCRMTYMYEIPEFIVSHLPKF